MRFIKDGEIAFQHGTASFVTNMTTEIKKYSNESGRSLDLKIWIVNLTDEDYTKIKKHIMSIDKLTKKYLIK